MNEIQYFHLFSMQFFSIIILYGCLNQDELSLAKKALDQHDLSSAEQLYRRLIQKESKNTKALAGLGWTYHLALQKDAAAQSFDRCLAIDSDNRDCLRGRASVALSAGEIPKAQSLLGLARMKYPDDPEILSTAALLDLSEGHLSAAESKFSSLVSRFPNRTEFRLGYAEALLRSTKIQDALQVTEKALSDTDLLPRYKAMFWLLRSRILLEGSAVTSSRVDALIVNDCQQRDAVLKWIEEAERSVEEAKSTGVSMPNFAIVQRQALRRKSSVLEKCPDNSDEVE
jgi:tetratricopeptide (TPR) repeat protein